MNAKVTPSGRDDADNESPCSEQAQWTEYVASVLARDEDKLLLMRLTRPDLIGEFRQILEEVTAYWSHPPEHWNLSPSERANAHYRETRRIAIRELIDRHPDVWAEGMRWLNDRKEVESRVS